MGDADRPVPAIRISGAGTGALPFRFSEPHDRVTDEGAPVRFLAPEHSLFRVPNRIGDEDFDGWVENEAGTFSANGIGATVRFWLPPIPRTRSSEG